MQFSRKFKTGVVGAVFSLALICGAQADPPAPPPAMPDVFLGGLSVRGPEYVVIVEKATQRLSVWEIQSPPRKLFETACSTGKVAGPKQVSGDGKTPEGIYFFIKEYQEQELAPIYGVGAFPTDYPNMMDRAADRTGSAIWLHGTNKPLEPMDSNGCIVLDNTDFKRVKPYIALNRTPLIVQERLHFKPLDGSGSQGAALATLVSAWNQTLKDGTYHDYVDFYHPDYVPDISWWGEWYKVRKTLLDAEDVAFEGRELVAYRFSDYFVTLFDQYMVLPEGTAFVGAKQFYLTLENERFRIVGENYPLDSTSETGRKDIHPLIAAASRVTPEKASYPAVQAVPNAEIETMLDGWLAAWSSQDIDAYGRYYAHGFQSQGMGKSAWLDYKERLNRKYDFIRVSRSDAIAEVAGESGTVTFTQHYESSGFKTVGKKELKLVRENGEWRIFREIWKGK